MLSVDEKTNSLKEMRLLKDAEIADLKELAVISHEVNFSDGQLIIVEGEPGDSIYLIVDGYVKVYKSGMEFMYGPKECVGEMAMIDDEPRSASVASLGETKLLRIERDDFNRIMYNNPRLLRLFLRLLVRKLRIGTVREDNTMQSVVKAGEIQNSILPKSEYQFPKSGQPAIKISSIYHPHPEEKVMGDYYDYFPISDHQIGIVIGDVMGHGIHTGMIVAITKGSIYTHIKFDHSISNVMSTINDMVYRFINAELSDLSDMYMTFCYIVIDTKNHTLSYSNAGHQAIPYLYHSNSGKFHALKAHSFKFGIIDDMEYDVSSRKWMENDILVLYTDGMIDAECQKGRPYGERRLKQAIMRNAHLSPMEIKNAILEDIGNYCKGIYNDDRSLVVVKMS
jgi:sigma-B regulation protein RsbU (phosphoserine phosphatase)